MHGENISVSSTVMANILSHRFFFLTILSSFPVLRLFLLKFCIILLEFVIQAGQAQISLSYFNLYFFQCFASWHK